MRQYVARRLLLALVSAVGASFVIFLMIRVIPGDPLLMLLGEEQVSRNFGREIERMRRDLGLDRPLPQQYVDWVKGMLTGNMGRSLTLHRPVLELFRSALPITLQLGVMALLLALLIAIPVGVLSALRQDTWVDYLFRVVSISGLALPSFWVATLVLIVMSVSFHWVPVWGRHSLFNDPLSNLQLFIWPALILGLLEMAVLSRMTRSTVLEVLRQDYVRTAWAKGLRERTVVVRHVLKNAALPVLTIAGIHTGHLLGGAVIQETIWGLPGMGLLLVRAASSRDYPVLQSFLLVMVLSFLLVNLVVDLLYAWLNPQIRYGRG